MKNYDAIWRMSSMKELRITMKTGSIFVDESDLLIENIVVVVVWVRYNG